MNTCVCVWRKKRKTEEKKSALADPSRCCDENSESIPLCYGDKMMSWVLLLSHLKDTFLRYSVIRGGGACAHKQKRVRPNDWLSLFLLFVTCGLLNCSKRHQATPTTVWYTDGYFVWDISFHSLGGFLFLFFASRPWSCVNHVASYTVIVLQPNILFVWGWNMRKPIIDVAD